MIRSLLLFAAIAATPALGEPTFHFYGAEDCPPCMAFKRDHLNDVIRLGAAEGFAVAENVTARTSEVATPGIFGAADAMLRDGLEASGGIAYPPLFVTSDDGATAFSHGADWATALAETRTRAAQ